MCAAYLRGRARASPSSVTGRRPLQPRYLPHHSCRSLPEGSSDYVPLGKSDVVVSSIGLGCLAWGDPQQGFGTRFDANELIALYNEARSLGINFFDSAEVYGYQSMANGDSSECILNRCLQQDAFPDRKAIVASKYFTIPWTSFLIGGGVRLGRKAISMALDATLARLGTSKVDLYQIHFPFPSYPDQVLMSGLQDAFESGRASAVGVCNYNAAQVERAHELLSAVGIPLASNQVEYSLMKRDVEWNGTLKMCQERDVTVIAHSPLKQGLLTEFALNRSDAAVERIKPLLKLLQFIGAISGGKSIEQIALNYLLCKGAVAIPGAKTSSQLQRNAGAMGWRLDQSEVEVIDEKLKFMEL